MKGNSESTQYCCFVHFAARLKNTAGSLPGVSNRYATECIVFASALKLCCKQASGSVQNQPSQVGYVIDQVISKERCKFASQGAWGSSGITLPASSGRGFGDLILSVQTWVTLPL